MGASGISKRPHECIYAFILGFDEEEEEAAAAAATSSWSSVEATAIRRREELSTCDKTRASVKKERISFFVVVSYSQLVVARQQY